MVATGNFYLQLMRQGDCAIIAIIAMSGKRNKMIYYQSRLFSVLLWAYNRGVARIF